MRPELIVTLALVLIPGIVRGVSVELVQTAADHCLIEPGHSPNGSLMAFATGGTAPYRYDWYDVSFGMIELCTDCGPERTGLTGYGMYKVVVTDALLATAEATLGVQAIVGVEVWSTQNLAYEADTAPVLVVDIQNDAPDANGDAPFVQIIPEPLFIYGPWPGSSSLVKAVMPVGTTSASIHVEHSGEYTCQTQEVHTFSAPTVLPDIELVEVEGSCSQFATGSATFVHSNGVLSSWLNVVVKDAAGNVLPGVPIEGVGPQPHLQTIHGLAPGDHWLVVTGDLIGSPMVVPGYTYPCRDSIPFTIPSLGPSCGQVKGALFLDANESCSREVNEFGVPATVLQILPGPLYAATDNTGLYDLVLPNGTYTIEERSPLVDALCDAGPIAFTINGGVVIRDIPSVSTVPMDVSVALVSGPARPGFEMTYGITVRDRTVTSTGTLTVSLQLDTSLAFLGANPAPSSFSNGTLTWSVPSLSVFQQRDITVRTQVPADITLLGTDLVSTAMVSSLVSDGDLTNNVMTDVRTVTGSYDPNDKLARTNTGSTALFDPTQDEWVDYTIRFQNTGTDTAFNVLLTDTLVASLDPSTLIMGAGSHPFTWELRDSGCLRIMFQNIQLPDSTVNEPRSHGSISFRIKPRSPVAPGTQIINRANIFFDFNPPIITEPSVLTVPTPPVLLSPRMYLGGAFSVASPTMNASLRTLPLFPRVEPYSAMGYVHTGTGGGEVVSPAALLITGNNAIVDWVVVELRETGGSGAVVASRAALLQRDGDVVGPNGSAPVAFYVPNGSSYRIAVRHRNHLGVMTATPRTLSTTPTSVDFGLSTTTTYGTNARNMINGTMVLWPGDVNDDGVVKYAGAANDRDAVLVGIGGIVPTNVVNNVYDPRDVNLDGNISYAGSNNDRDVILQAIGGLVPTAVRAQQLP